MNKSIGHLINGKRVAGTSGQTGPIFNPATGEQTGEVAFASASELQAAVDAARDAQPAWANTSIVRRARTMFKLKSLIEANMDELAEMVTSEHGKTLDDAKGSITRGLEVVEGNATALPFWLARMIEWFGS